MAIEQVLDSPYWQWIKRHGDEHALEHPGWDYGFCAWQAAQADQAERLARLAAQVGARERLLHAIRPYVKGEIDDPHRSECAVYDPIQHGPCDCGWDQVKAELLNLANPDAAAARLLERLEKLEQVLGWPGIEQVVTMACQQYPTGIHCRACDGDLYYDRAGDRTVGHEPDCWWVAATAEGGEHG